MSTSVLTVLGCGGSGGVPMIGNYWGSCDPAEPRNFRTRPSAMVQNGDDTIVIDTGADFRGQLNRENVTNVSAVFYTHVHSDHVNGIDDLRPIRNRTKRKIPIFGTAPVLTYLAQRFDYMFKDIMPFYPAVLDPYTWSPEIYGVPQTCGATPYVLFEQDHGNDMKTLGFRFGDVAYSTDMADLESTAIEALRGVKVWVADGNNLYDDDKGPHANLETLQRLNEQIGAEIVYATHLKTNLDYQTLRRELPKGYRPAFDGLKISLDGTVLNDDAGQ